MKLIYYQRVAHPPFDVVAGANAKCFYAPAKRVVIFIERSSPFQGDVLVYTEDPMVLEEAEGVATGLVPRIEGIEFVDVREFDIDEYKLTSFLDDARAKEVLEARVRAGIKEFKGLVHG